MTNPDLEHPDTKSGDGIVATKGSLSEKLLAHTLGYPLGWHVVRTITDSGEYSDCIYAGNPNKKRGLDMYFNHVAAYTAALKWKVEESTGFENGGGQLLPRVSTFNVGDKIEVLYEPDDCWYDGTILKIKEYEDDIRYTIHYTEEDSTQTNVCEDLIRFPDPNSKKKKKKKKKKTAEKSSKETKKKTPAKKSKDTSSKKAKIKASIDRGNQKTMDVFFTSPKNKTTKKRKMASPEVDHAKEMGLPEGWAVRLQTNNKNYTFCSPDGQKFRSKKSALAHVLATQNNLSTEPPVTVSTTKEKKEKKIKKKSGKKSSPRVLQEIEEEGDPPWRQIDHDYLGKRVIYKTILPHDESVEISQTGTVVGWIDEADVDTEGDPGFISERTGIPAPLFHVIFDNVTHTKSNEQYNSYLLESQDLEEYELLDCLMDEKEEEEFNRKTNGGFIIHHGDGESKDLNASSEDEDEVPLSLLKKKKIK